MVVEEILIDFNDETLLLTMTIHWKGGVHTQVKFKKPVKDDSPPNKTDENVVDLLKKLSKHYPDEEIARILNDSPRTKFNKFSPVEEMCIMNYSIHL